MPSRPLSAWSMVWPASMSPFFTKLATRSLSSTSRSFMAFNENAYRGKSHLWRAAEIAGFHRSMMLSPCFTLGWRRIKNCSCNRSLPVDFRAGILHHLRPFGDLARHEAPELLGALAARGGALRRPQSLDFRQLQHLQGRLVEAIQDPLGRAPYRPQS